MAGKNVVVRSINSQDGSRCVDLFERPDGTFGFEKYRRDVEDSRGWFPIGFFADQVFESGGDALSQARYKISWLDADADTG